VLKVVNIFAPRASRAAMFWAAHASRVLATPKAFANRGLSLSARNQNQMAKFMKVRFGATPLQRLRSNGQAFKSLVSWLP